MAGTAHQKFNFDTVFDGDGAVAYAAPRVKRSYTPDEVEQIRAEALAEGERSVVAQAETVFADAVRQIAAAAQAALSGLAQVAHDHRTGSAQLALAAGRKVADAALDRFPEAPVAAALTELAREIEAAPRLTVRVSPDIADRVQTALADVSQAIGFAGAINVTTDEAMPPAAFVMDWGEGRAAFDPQAAAARISAALDTALAAEGLHAEPLIPAPDALDNEADHG